MYLFWKYDRANGEMAKTSKLASNILYYQLENNLPASKRMKWLLKDTSIGCPQLTAANVMLINFAQCISLVVSLITFITVIIQMNGATFCNIQAKNETIKFSECVDVKIG